MSTPSRSHGAAIKGVGVSVAHAEAGSTHAEAGLRHRNRQRPQPAKRDLPAADWLAGKTQAFEPSHQHADRELTLQPRERRAETEVDAAPERDVRIRIPTKIEP